MTTFVYEEHEPCGCGSGKPFGSCCLKNGHIKLQAKPALPSGVFTGFAHKRCFFSSDRNCCGKISGDHVISRTVLRVLTQKQITISTPTFSRRHSLDSNSLKTKQLCVRHNSAMSPIDTEAGRFFQAFSSINSMFNGGAECQRLFLFHGTDLERWLLKTIITTFLAGLSDINARTARLPIMMREYFRIPLPRPFGLYLKSSSTDFSRPHFATENAVSVSLGAFDGVLSDAVVTLGGLELHLLLRPTSAIEAKTLSYRPPKLIFFKGQAISCIMFAWEDSGGQDICFSHSDPNAPVPEGIYGTKGFIQPIPERA